MRLTLFLILLRISLIGQTTYAPLRSVTVKQPYLEDAVDMLRYGNPEGTIKFIKNAPDKVKQSFEAEFLLGYAYKVQGEIQSALEAFSRATRYESNSLPAFFERGNCYLLKKNFNLAVFDYDRVLLIDSTFVPAYNNRAYARIRNYGDQSMPLTQLRFARKDMEQVLHYANESQGLGYEFYFNMGLLDLYLSEYEKAIASFNQAVMLDGNIAKVYYYRGAAHFLARYYSKARFDFEASALMGFNSEQTPEFLKVLDLIRKHEEENDVTVGKE
jgi:tetratricopeptide (TPR) repeat protein